MKAKFVSVFLPRSPISSRFSDIVYSNIVLGSRIILRRVHGVYYSRFPVVLKTE